MKTNETSEIRLYNSRLNSYAEWNGFAWEDKNCPGAYFYSIEKANNNGWFKERSVQEKLDWFNNLSAGHKASLVNHYLNKTDYIATDSEIEFIYNESENIEIKAKAQPLQWNEWATGGEKVLEILNSKPNQKQFKSFDETLFKSYINKFSNEDKLKALNILASGISTTDSKLNSLLNQISDFK